MAPFFSGWQIGRRAAAAGPDPTIVIPAAIPAGSGSAAAPGGQQGVLPPPHAAGSPLPPGSPMRRALQPSQQLPWQRLRKAVESDPIAYMQALGTLGPCARPSSLQPLLKRGQHVPSSLCRPRLALGSTQLADLPTDRAGQLLPTQAGVAQCYLSLGTVKGVPHSGICGRKVWLQVVRACLYDGSRFHGNVQAIKPRRVKQGKSSQTWSFDPAPLLVRCPEDLLPKMQVYIELNVSYELLAEEVQRLPPKAERAARQVDEVSVAWALVDLSTLSTLHTARSLSMPLHGGPLARRMSVRECAAAALAAQGRKGSFGGGSAASKGRLAAKLAPVPPSDSIAALLPAAAVVSAPVAQVVALYRLLLADALGTAEGGTVVAPVADHVLASFPTILDDADLAHAFFTLWEMQAAPRVARVSSELKAVLRSCVTIVWAGMGSQVVPAPSIANNTSHQRERRQRIENYLQQHPVAGVNSAAHASLHKPFSTEELLCGPMQQHGVTV